VSRRSASVRLPAPSRPSITTSRPTGPDTVSGRRYRYRQEVLTEPFPIEIDPAALLR
jgi:hypothetical protein